MKYPCVKDVCEIRNSRHRQGWYLKRITTSVPDHSSPQATNEEEKWNDENMEHACDNQNQANYGAAGMQRRCM